VFGAFLVRELGAKMAYVPADSGVFSALGMLTTDIVFQEERSATLRSPVGEDGVSAINRIYGELEQRVRQRFEATGLDPSKVEMRRAVDMRFGMQVHELEVDVPGGPLSLADVNKIASDFVEKYEQTYGRDSAYTAAGIEYVTLRAIGTMDVERPPIDVPAEVAEGSSSLIGRRQAYFAPGGFVDTEIHTGPGLRPGQRLSGPAIVQRAGDTVVLPPGFEAAVDKYGGITITWQETRA
jgi:N-methylhydantoinase A